MEDLFVGILTMLLIVALIPLFLWKRRRDSQSQDENEEEREVWFPLLHIKLVFIVLSV